MENRFAPILQNWSKLLEPENTARMFTLMSADPEITSIIFDTVYNLTHECLKLKNKLQETSANVVASRSSSSATTEIAENDLAREYVNYGDENCDLCKSNSKTPLTQVKQICEYHISFFRRILTAKEKAQHQAAPSPSPKRSPRLKRKIKAEAETESQKKTATHA